MRDVAVIGVGITKYGELWSSPLRDLHAEAVADCLADAGVERSQIQSHRIVGVAIQAKRIHSVGLLQDGLDHLEFSQEF